METDVNGFFKFPDRGPVDCGKVVFFWAAGFLPQIKIVDEATKELHVVLEAAGQGRVVPSCSDIQTPGMWLGWPLKVRVPKGASVEKYRGLHGHGYSIRVRSKKRRIELNGYIDQYAYGYPRDNLILTAAEYTIRVWRSGKEEGMDFQGRAANGMRWRYFTIIGEEVYYDDVTDEEARILDGIIDGACFQPLSKR